jgi:cytosine/uracil/thiamine/allantoin permease
MGIYSTIAFVIAVIAQVVEHIHGKNEVNSASLFNGSIKFAILAQLVEHSFRKAGVPSSILGDGSFLI